MKQITKAKILLPLLFSGYGFAALQAQTCFDPGTGIDGAYSATSNTTITGGTYNYTTFNISSGVTVTVTGNQPLILHCTGAVTIDGILTANGGNGNDGVTFSNEGTGGIGVAGGGNGGDGSYSSSNGPLPGLAGSGPGGVNDQGDGWSGGGGSGYAATGNSSGGAGGFGGPSYGDVNISGLEAGSGGGGGSGGYSCGSGGGGAGGGTIVINSGVSITIGASGSVQCKGGNGGSDGTGNCGGGGGGSGGAIWLAASSMTNNGTILGTGGTGGASTVPGSPYYGIGATGSDGRIRLDYDNSLAGTGTVSPAAGSHFTIPSAVFTTAIAGFPASCNGANDGSAVVTAFNGTPSYTYSWSPVSSTSSVATNLAPGTYSCTISDAGGCMHTETVTITEPTAISVTSSATDLQCNGDGSGTASVTVSGGTPSYTYSWLPAGGSAAAASGLSAGSYTCMITDANGCTTNESVTITEPTAITVVVANVTDASTCGGSDGAIDITVTGGAPGYTYMWSNGANTQNVTTITTGAYTCTVTDVSGCTTTVTATVNNPAPPAVTLAIGMDTACQTTQAPFMLTGESPSGGTYSGPGVSAGMFDPMAASLGYNMISYTYTDMNTGCSATAVDSIWVDVCSGISANAAISGIVVSPNPSNGLFTIRLGSVPAKAANVEVMNSLGQLVQSFTMTNQSSEVNLANAENGFYTIRINDGENVAVIRVIKQ